MTTARLGFAVDSSQADRAAVDLDKLAASATKAEGASKRLATSSSMAETATGQFARASAGAMTATGQLERSLDGVASASQRMATSARAATGAVQALEVASMSSGMAMMRNQQLMFQWVDIAQSLPLLLSGNIYGLQNLGFQMAQIGQLYYGQGGMGMALRDSAAMLGRFALYASPAIVAIGALGLAIFAMQQEINKASDVTVSFGDTALATWQVVRDGIATTLQPAFSALGTAVSFVWEHIKNGTKGVVNLIINSFRAAFEDIKLVWESLPNIIGAAAVGAGNVVIRTINGMVNGALEGMNKLIRAINSVASFLGAEKAAEWLGLGGDGQIDEFAPWKGFALDDNKFARRLAGTASGRNARISEIMSSDPLGSFFDAVSARATENALRDVEAAAGGAGGAIGKAANDNVDPWKGLRGAVDQASEAMETAREFAQGFASDFTQGLRNGESVWESFKNAGLNAIGKIADALVTSGINSIFSGGMGGGFFGNLLGGIGSLFGFAKGAAFQAGNLIPFANGGVVGGPAAFPMSGGRTGLMGEAGPEAIMPLKRGRDGKLGVAANSNQPAQSTPTLRIEQHFHISGAVSSRDVEQMVRQGSEQAVAVVKDALPGWQTDIQVYGRPA